MPLKLLSFHSNRKKTCWASWYFSFLKWITFTVFKHITTSKIIFFFLSFFCLFVLKPPFRKKGWKYIVAQKLKSFSGNLFLDTTKASDFEVFSALQKSRKHVCVVIWSSMIIFVPLHCSDFKSPTNITIACYLQNGYNSISVALDWQRGYTIIYSPWNISDFNRD